MTEQLAVNSRGAAASEQSRLPIRRLSGAADNAVLPRLRAGVSIRRGCSASLRQAAGVSEELKRGASEAELRLRRGGCLAMGGARNDEGGCAGRGMQQDG